MDLGMARMRTNGEVEVDYNGSAEFRGWLSK
jgi:hypothetical protein